MYINWNTENLKNTYHTEKVFHCVYICPDVLYLQLLFCDRLQAKIVKLILCIILDDVNIANIDEEIYYRELIGNLSQSDSLPT